MKLKDAAFIMYGIRTPETRQDLIEVWDNADPDGEPHYFETCAACVGEKQDDEGNHCDECKGQGITPIDQEKSGHVEIE